MTTAVPTCSAPPGTRAHPEGRAALLQGHLSTVQRMAWDHQIGKMSYCLLIVHCILLVLLPPLIQLPFLPREKFRVCVTIFCLTSKLPAQQR